MEGTVPVGGWFDRHAAKEAAKDKMPYSERFGQIFGFAITLLVAAYFTSLYNSRSGFFTSSFSGADAILFFGIAYFGLVPVIAKAVIGRKNAIRPLDIALSIAVLMAAISFLSSFPFDFSHLAGGLPQSLQFLLSWITDGIAKGVMMLVIVVSIFVIPYTVLLYISVRRKLRHA